ncbi:GNAT family N-acetyltransferase [Marivibrio halodurans]|uniref:GNAT family N-acetyltransferase n=1 Tax=Marivibrio halodurans TaxID=2039722 RepID=A0A8J7S5F8_9PROT|nr:GNAT family N-acetyltransferase [Marivibrio halodurans]MBP5855922.1 GNAT family N-acetyltransferase [Marivibrio halodurans]
MVPETPAPALSIEHATAADEPEWLTLWHGYLRFYRAHLPDGTTRATWRRILDETHPFRCFVARDRAGGAVLGFALHFPHPSSWCTVGEMYLEDLYVADDARGRGVGRALIEAVKESARAEKLDRVYWMTETDNATARALYDRLAGGADDYVRYRLKV